jgi:acid phosphatase family membrane protein YuiD
MFATGGMPSGHAAATSAIATAAILRHGLFSDISVVALFFAIVTMRDAFGVRRASGEQAKTLNSLGKALAQKLKIDYNPVKEVKGHSPAEVVAGAMTGVAVAVILHITLT